MMRTLVRSLCAGLLVVMAGQVTAANQLTVEEALASGFPAQGEVLLSPKRLVQLTVALNAEVLYADLQAEVAAALRRAEQSLYDPTVYSSYTYEDRDRKRTVEEQQASLFNPNPIDVLYEEVNTAETGVRSRLPTGGEVSLGYRLSERKNNIISGDASGDFLDSESDGSLTLSLKQPLLRGFGRDVTETDLRVAELELDISKLQYEQQLLRSIADAINAYWSLYRAYAVMAIRRDALDNARAIEQDVQRRVDGGRVAGDDLLEAQISVASRQAEVSRAEQLVSDAEAKIKTLLSISGGEHADLHFQPARDPRTGQEVGPSFDERYQRALETWPSYQIAQLRRRQEDLRLVYAADQRKPVLNFVLGYSTTSLDTEAGVAFKAAFNDTYPDWHVGLSFEMPLGNRRADSEFRAQQERAAQADLQIENVKHTLGNELRARYQQVDSAFNEVQQLEAEVALRTRLLESAQTQYRLGKLRLGQMLEREDDLNESRQRLVESAARLELARVAMLLAESRLLQTYEIEVTH